MFATLIDSVEKTVDLESCRKFLVLITFVGQAIGNLSRCSELFRWPWRASLCNIYFLNVEMN